CYEVHQGSNSSKHTLNAGLTETTIEKTIPNMVGILSGIGVDRFITNGIGQVAYGSINGLSKRYGTTTTL
ncbi:MAG: hypothetical protein VB913_05940, partial [Rhodospirillales bacterium]